MGDIVLELMDTRFAADQLRFAKRQENRLRAKAHALGFQLVPVENAGMVPQERNARVAGPVEKEPGVAGGVVDTEGVQAAEVGRSVSGVCKPD